VIAFTSFKGVTYNGTGGSYYVTLALPSDVGLIKNDEYSVETYAETSLGAAGASYPVYFAPLSNPTKSAIFNGHRLRYPLLLERPISATMRCAIPLVELEQLVQVSRVTRPEP